MKDLTYLDKWATNPFALRWKLKLAYKRIFRTGKWS